ncbi:hypothetical protein OQA88_4610 [Cercophora sp. LCS_1]
MRLINVHTRRLELFYNDPFEDYAILSHTWASEEEELSFEDMMALAERGAGRTTKLDGCCEQAKKDGIKYVWIDTCCIDKKNAFCYTYLSDVEPGQPKGSISTSPWFTRGWTLQELLASPKIKFFDSGWNALGTKVTLAGLLVQATGIPHHILTGFASLDTASVAQRFSWASRRQTTRPEDMSYCLFGIFDVTIPLFYGEGLESAFERLQEAIMRKNLDDSILAWSLGEQESRQEQSVVLAKSAGILATSPADFEGCGNIVRRPQTERRIQAFEIFGGLMPITISLDRRLAVPSEPLTPARFAPYARYGYLSCGPESRDDLVIAIPLAESRSESRIDGIPIYLRPRGLNSILVPEPRSLEAPSRILIRKDRVDDVTNLGNKPSWFYLPGPYPWNTTVEEVYPPEFYESDVAMIKTPERPDGDKTLFLIRLSYSVPDRPQAEMGHFVVALEFLHDSSAGNKEPRAHLYFDDDVSIPLSEVAGFWASLVPTSTTELVLVATPLAAVRVSLKMETIAGHRLWVLKLADLPPSHVPKYSQGWPRIKQQIFLRKQMQDLVQLLQGEAAVSQEYGASTKDQARCDMEICDLEKSLEILAEKRRTLDAKERGLQVQLKGQKEMKEPLSRKVEECNAKQRRLHTLVEFIETTGAFPWPTAVPPIQAERTEEVRLEREGNVAHLMQQDPVIIDGEKVDWVQGMTLLMYASAKGNEALIRRALRYGGDIQAKDSTGRTAIGWAYLTQRSELLDKIILEVESDPNETGFSGQALDQKVDIINIGWVTRGDHPDLKAAITRALSRPTLVFCSTTNGTTYRGDVCLGGYHEKAITVADSGRYGNLLPVSDGNVDMFLPCQEIVAGGPPSMVNIATDTVSGSSATALASCIASMALVIWGCSTWRTMRS